MSSNIGAHRLLFGTAGTPVSAKYLTTQSGIERIAELGLGCMEVEFVQGVRMSRATAFSVGKTAAGKGITLTAHGPYFINLNASEPEKVTASKERILQTARIACILGAGSITFHVAFYLKKSRIEAYNTVKNHLEDVLKVLNEEDIKIMIRPEVTGKPSQFGTLEEILELSADLEGIAPCIDFSHLHARTGKANSYQEFDDILRQVEGKLGRQALDDMHIHLSGVAYGGKGEIKHLMLQESDLQYADLLRAMKERQVGGVVICESAPYLERDALLLQQTYEEL